MTPIALRHPCCWTLCPHMATTQVTVSAPPWLDHRAAAWFCARHERMWQIAIGTGCAWVNYAFGRAPLFGWGIVRRGSS